MTFSLHQGGVVMSSQITRIKHTPLAHILDTCALIFSMGCAIFLQFITPLSVNPSHLQVITTRAREVVPKEHGAMQKWPRATFSYIRTRALHSFLSFAHCRAASTVSSLLPKATFTPSIQPNLGLPRPALHLLPPSTPIWPYDTHSFLPHELTISIFSGVRSR